MPTLTKAKRKSVDEENPNEMRYLSSGIPRKPLQDGRVLVHNHVVPQRLLGLNGFRAWTQKMNERLEVCPCDWAGVDLHGLVHYRVKAAVTKTKARKLRVGDSFHIALDVSVPHHDDILLESGEVTDISGDVVSVEINGIDGPVKFLLRHFEWFDEMGYWILKAEVK